MWVGAHIRKANGSYGRVQFLAVEREAQVMYNLTVAEAHTFFVGAQRWLVHNVCQILGKQTTPIHLDNSFRYQERTDWIEGLVTFEDLNNGTRSTTAQTWAKSMGERTDEAGHLIAESFGGPGGVSSGNIAPISPSTNRSHFGPLENAIRKYIKGTQRSVHIRVDLDYISSSTRPDRIHYFAVDAEDGTVIAQKSFDNPIEP